MAACCSINMRIFKTTELILLLFFIVSSCSSAPGRNPHELSSPIDPPAPTDPSVGESGDHYDQRQNGTENYRINVDGLVVVVAPVEALLLAGGLAGNLDSSIFGIEGGLMEKPQKPEAPAEPRPEPEEPSEPSPKPEAKPELIKDKLNAKSAHRPEVRLMSLLSPLFRKVHRQH